MEGVFHMDVAKVDQDVVHVAKVIHVCSLQEIPLYMTV
jgi:hypothetical protein